jgi:hypothetical protein
MRALANAFVLGALAAGALAPRVEAQEPPTVYIVSVATEPELEAAAARVGAAARASLREVAGVEWAGADRVFLGYDDVVWSRLATARERLEEGRQAFLDLDFERSSSILASSVEDFDAAAGALEDTRGLAEALLYLGASQTFARRTRDARRTFARLHVQMPQVAPDPNEFPPEIITAYESARPRDAGSPSARLSVTSEPAGAIAYIDYVARGSTPVTVPSLAGGSHVVRVTRPGGAPFVQSVDIRSGGSDEVTAFLDETETTTELATALSGLVDADVERAEPGSAIAEVGRILGVEQVGVIRVGRGESEGRVALELLFFDVEHGRRRLRVHGPVPEAPGALELGVRQLVSQALAAALRPRQASEDETPRLPPDLSVQQGGDDDDGSIFETWYFWTAIAGVLVAGAAVVTIIALSSDDTGSDAGGQLVLEF